MYDMTKKELAPTEDQSILFFMATAPQTATIDYDIHYVKQVQQVFEQIPEYKESFILAGFGGDTSSTFGGFKMAQPSSGSARSPPFNRSCRARWNRYLASRP
jgi:multidrug efflux pump